MCKNLLVNMNRIHATKAKDLTSMPQVSSPTSDLKVSKLKGNIISKGNKKDLPKASISLDQGSILGKIPHTCLLFPVETVCIR